MKQSCKTCKWLKVNPNARGVIVVRANGCYQCVAPETPKPALPESATKFMAFSWPPHRKYMSGAEGYDCLVYEARKK